MKNIFKKLAFVLSLAMVLGLAAPAATASAALNVSTNVKSAGKTVWVNDKFDINIKGLPKNWKNTYKVEYVSSDESMIEVVNAGSGIVQFLSVGKGATATVNCNIISKKTNKVVKTVPAKFWIKESAAKIELVQKGGAEIPANLPIGKDVIDLDSYMYNAAGVKSGTRKDYVTDYRQFKSSDETVATVTSGGKVTTLKEGEVTISVSTFVASNYSGTATQTASVKFVVKGGMISAKQTTVNAAEVVFDIDTFKTSDIKVFKVVSGTDVPQVVKSVAVDGVDKKKATLSLYVNFDKDAEYKVVYGDKTLSFKGADASAEAVTYITIATTEAEIQKETEINVKYFNAANVDITSDELKNRTDINLVSGDSCYLGGKKITIFEKGKVAAVKATFHTYDYTTKGDGTEVTIVAEQSIVGVDKISQGVTALTGKTILAPGKALDWNADLKMSASDDKGTYRLVVKGKIGDTEYVSDAAETLFSFESSDKNALYVDAQGNLFPVKTGTYPVLVKYNGIVIEAVNITIIDNRKVVEVNINQNKTVLSIGETADDSIVLSVEVKDQLGALLNSTPRVEILSQNVPTVPYEIAAVANSTGKYTITFSGKTLDASAANKTLQFKVVTGDITKVYSFIIKAAGEAKVYRAEFSNATIDTKIDLANSQLNLDNYKTDIKLVAYDANGVKVKDLPLVNGEPSGDGFYFTVNHVDNGNQAVVSGTSFSALKVASVVSGGAVSGSAVTKAPAGIYKVTVYQKVNGVSSAKDSKYITVKDTQVLPIAGSASKLTSSAVGALDATLDCYSFKLDGKDFKNGQHGTFHKANIIGKETNGTAFIKSLVGRVTFNSGTLTYDFEVAINNNLSFTPTAQ